MYKSKTQLSGIRISKVKLAIAEALATVQTKYPELTNAEVILALSEESSALCRLEISNSNHSNLMPERLTAENGKEK